MTLHSRFVLLVGLLLLLVLGSSPVLFSQGTDLGTIRGTVSDSTGAVVANARRTALDVRTGAMRQTTTNSSGEYQMFGLPSGNYKVTITSPGMGTHDITN